MEKRERKQPNYFIHVAMTDIKRMQQATQLIFSIYIWFCLAMLVLYLPRIIYYFFGFRKQKKLVSDKKNKIAVIIPARNESSVIVDCLNSLTVQCYDKEFFDIHIVVADESDPTVDIAKKHDRTYITVVENQTSKGEALDGVLKKILKETPDKYDAFLFVDADNLAATDLLTEMNNALASGKQIICAKKHVKNWKSRLKKSRSFVANCTGLIYTMVDELGNKARNKFNSPVTVIGTGVMVKACVIKELDGWPFRTLTEDYELTAEAIVRGYSSMYYSFARVYTEEATDRKTASIRKMRWVKGHVETKRKYRGEIFKKAFTGKISFLNIGFVFGTLPFSMFCGISLVAFIYGLIAIGFMIAGSVALITALLMALMPIALVYGSLFIYTFIILLVDRKAITIPVMSKIALLFFHPFFAWGYFPIYIKSYLTHKDSLKWQATNRVPFESKEEQHFL